LKKKIKSIRERKYLSAAPIGAALILFAIIGLISVLVLCYNYTTRLLDNSKEKAQFEELLLPVLMFDPIPFEDVSTVDPLSLLQSSLWATMLGEKRGTFEFADNGRMIIPQAEVDMTAANLFGPDVQLQHQTFGDVDISYVYDSETKTYQVPVTSPTGFYIPKVVSIKKDKDIYTLIVGYVPPSDVWNIDFEGNNTQPNPDKYMTYVLKKVEKHYQLIAIQNVPQETLQELMPNFTPTEGAGANVNTSGAANPNTSQAA
jgi:hypothetical protein